MVYQFGNSPQVQSSSSSRTTTVRTTQSTSGGVRPSLLGGHTTLLPTTIPSAVPMTHTTTQYVTTGVPMVTQTRYASATPLITTGPMMTTTTTGASTIHSNFMKPQLMTAYPALGNTLDSLSVTPFRQSFGQVAPAQMGLATEVTPFVSQRQASSHVTYSNSASLTINDVRCEGFIAVANDKIVEAKNLFVGTAPFVLSQETLEVTPEMTVVARNPNIKYHLGDLPTAQFESLTLPELRKVAGLDENTQVWIGLPGQAASMATELNGAIQFIQHSQPAFVPAFHS